MSANNNLSAVYFTREPDSRGFDQVETRVTERNDGTLLKDGRPLRARYVLTGAETRVVGTLIAKRDGSRSTKSSRPCESPVQNATDRRDKSACPQGSLRRGATAHDA